MNSQATSWAELEAEAESPDLPPSAQSARFMNRVEKEGKCVLQRTAESSFVVILVHLAHSFLLSIFHCLYSK